MSYYFDFHGEFEITAKDKANLPKMWDLLQIVDANSTLYLTEHRTTKHVLSKEDLATQAKHPFMKKFNLFNRKIALGCEHCDNKIECLMIKAKDGDRAQEQKCLSYQMNNLVHDTSLSDVKHKISAIYNESVDTEYIDNHTPKAYWPFIIVNNNDYLHIEMQDYSLNKMGPIEIGSWLYFIRQHIIIPNDGIMNGNLDIDGEEKGDFSEIVIKDNKIGIYDKVLIRDKAIEEL